MSQQLLTNIFLALFWAWLQDSFHVLDIFTGFLIGMAILYVFNRTQKQDFYMRKIWAAIKLLALFTKELIIANIIVASQVLSPRLNISPGVIALPLDVKSDLEITILANMISLTPGTLTMDISPDNNYLYIHVFHIEDAELIKKNIKESFEKGIMEVAR